MTKSKEIGLGCHQGKNFSLALDLFLSPGNHEARKSALPCRLYCTALLYHRTVVQVQVPSDPRLKLSAKRIFLPLNCFVDIVFDFVFEVSCPYDETLTVDVHGLMSTQEHIKARHKMLTWDQTHFDLKL